MVRDRSRNKALPGGFTVAPLRKQFPPARPPEESLTLNPHSRLMGKRWR